MSDKMLSETEIREHLKNNLTEKRFNHSIAVASEAVRLACRWGADEEKAYLAGLVHDCCKDMPANIMLQTADDFGILLSDLEKAAPKLWHARVGAVYLNRVFGIEDEEIADAVRYHTTARAGMSLLEKILYLADFTSADRDYDGVEEMRKAVDESMEKAMTIALCFTIGELSEKQSPIHEDTFAAYNEVMLNK